MSDQTPSYRLDDLLKLMSRLRDPEDGCPWDLQQDFASIVPHTLEEAYEVADAIERGDLGQTAEELGDLLFQVVFYSQLGREQGAFDFHQIIDTLTTKLIRRHPHVFPAGTLESRKGEQNSEIPEVKQRWETIKAEERAEKSLKSVLDDVPLALPALSRSVKLQKRASRVGFDWDNASEVLYKIREEIDELLEAQESGDEQAIEAEYGDVLFALSNLGRHLKVDPERALRGTNQRFEARFRFIEEALAERGTTPEQSDLATMDALWDEAKRQGL